MKKIKKHKEHKHCEGIKTSGYWKGYRCGAYGIYEVDGHWYCANHRPFKQDEKNSYQQFCKEEQG